MNLLSLLALFLFSTQVSAIHYGCLPSSPDGTENYTLGGPISRNDTYPNLELNRPARIFYSSQGGEPEGAAELIRWLRGQVARGTVRPTIIMKEWCESSCILVLAALNQMDLRGEIRLVLDPRLTFGFHGCVRASTGQLNQACQDGITRQLVANGVSRDWIQRNPHLWSRPQVNYMVNSRPTDSGFFQGSRLIHHAEIKYIKTPAPLGIPGLNRRQQTATSR